MKIVIDIDENVFTRLFDNGVDTSPEDREVIDRAVRNGKPYEERPKGKWEYNQYDGNPNIGNWHCSECRYIDYGGGYNQKPHYNFCPNCGAKMTKEAENEKNNLGAYANYDKCIPCVYMSFHGCTHPYRDEIGDVNGCVYFADAQKERDNE